MRLTCFNCKAWQKRRGSTRRSSIRPFAQGLGVEHLELRTLLAGDLPPLVDIRPTGLDSQFSNPTEMNAALYFTAHDSSGEELWKSDGTVGGTSRVKDIRPGIQSSSPALLTNVNGTLFFRANDGTGDTFQLWKSDGTESGTTKVRSIPSASAYIIPSFTKFGEELYFAAASSFANSQLWKSDGTLEGTVVVANIPQTPSLAGTPYYLTNVSGTLYFWSDRTSNGIQLWKSDGTENGTSQVRSFGPGWQNPSHLPFMPIPLVDVEGTLYFRAMGLGSQGIELWKSDGTASGTMVVRDIRPGSYSSYPIQLTNLAGTLFFTANDGTSGTELWKSDGTVDGTVRVKDIRIGISSSSPRNLTNVNGTLYFTADNGVNGYELWRSDGTEAGTEIVKDITSGPTGSLPNHFVNANGTLFFSAYTPENGIELWKSDGTEKGTVLVLDIASEAASSSPANLQLSNNVLYFSASTATYGREPYALSLSNSVVGSFVYHRNSSFDDMNSDITAALDTSKLIAKEGSLAKTLTFDNLINTTQGVNGLVFDMQELLGPVTAEDFVFQVSPTGIFDEETNLVTEWTKAPAPSNVSVILGTPDRIVISWPNRAIVNRWLRVTILANGNTGLARNEVYYIGHLLGETTEPNGSAFSVSFSDIIAIRDAVGSTVNSSSIHDIDKNGTVAYADITAVRSYIGTQLTIITIPASGGSGSLVSKLVAPNLSNSSFVENRNLSRSKSNLMPTLPTISHQRRCPLTFRDEVFISLLDEEESRLISENDFLPQNEPNQSAIVFTRIEVRSKINADSLLPESDQLYCKLQESELVTIEKQSS